MHDYQQTLEWLFARSRQGKARDTARMQRLIMALGLRMPAHTVHVVGTNGKGSVTSMLAHGLSAVAPAGRFISPHVEDFRERIAADQTLIAPEDVVAFVRSLQTQLDGSEQADFAFFEATFAMALWWFARQGLTWAVIEAGVGAKHDATRVLTNVRAVVLTSVSLDHTQVLGDTITAITQDKADAIRPGVPVITAVTGDALAVVQDVADTRSSPLYTPETHPELFDLPDGTSSSHHVRVYNQRLAAACLRVLKQPERAVLSAMHTPALPARREHFVYQSRHVILDGAHDPGAASALQASLNEPYTLLFGALAKKQGQATLKALESSASFVVLTYANDEVTALTSTKAHVLVPDAHEALVEAVRRTPEQGMIVIAGSLYLAGQLRPLLRMGA